MSYSQRNACPPKLKGAALAWGYMLLSAIGLVLNCSGFLLAMWCAATLSAASCI